MKSRVLLGKHSDDEFHLSRPCRFAASPALTCFNSSGAMSQLAFPTIYYAAVRDCNGTLQMRIGSAPDNHIRHRIDSFLERPSGAGLTRQQFTAEKESFSPHCPLPQQLVPFVAPGLPTFSLRIATEETALGMAKIAESLWLVVVYSLAACVMMPKGSPQLEHLFAACSEMVKRGGCRDEDLKELVERRPYGSSGIVGASLMIILDVMSARAERIRSAQNGSKLFHQTWVVNYCMICMQFGNTCESISTLFCETTPNF